MQGKLQKFCRDFTVLINLPIFALAYFWEIHSRTSEKHGFQGIRWDILPVSANASSVHYTMLDRNLSRIWPTLHFFCQPRTSDRFTRVCVVVEKPKVAWNAAVVETWYLGHCGHSFHGSNSIKDQNMFQRWFFPSKSLNNCACSVLRDILTWYFAWNVPRWRVTRLSGHPEFPANSAIASTVRMQGKIKTCFKYDFAKQIFNSRRSLKYWRYTHVAVYWEVPRWRVTRLSGYPVHFGHCVVGANARQDQNLIPW